MESISVYQRDTAKGDQRPAKKKRPDFSGLFAPSARLGTADSCFPPRQFTKNRLDRTTPPESATRITYTPALTSFMSEARS